MKFLTAPAFLVTICCLTATGAQAADISRKVTADGTLIVTITGEINLDDEKKFEEATLFAVISQHAGKSVIVKLNSRGGRNRPAALMGYRIRAQGYETRIEAGSICNSACTLVFLAGTYRHMDPGTQLGFHTSHLEDGSWKRDEESNKLVAAYMVYMGVPQQIIDLMPKADPCCLNYVSHDQAQQWGVLKGRPDTVAKIGVPEPKAEFVLEGAKPPKGRRARGSKTGG